MMIYVIIIILLLNGVRPENSLLIKKYKSVNQEECFINIYSKIHPVKNLVVITNGYNDYEIDFYKYNNSVTFIDVSKNFSSYKNFHEYFDIHVVFVSTIDDLNLFQQFYGYPFFNPRGKYLIISTLPKVTNNVFKILWTYFIINVIVLQTNSGSNDLYTYYPYEDNKCGDDITYKYLGSCQKDLNVNFYPNKLPKIAPGCKIVSCPLTIPPYTIDFSVNTDESNKAGFETVIAKNFIKRTNLTEVIDTQHKDVFHGSMNTDGNFTGPFYNIFDKTCDLSFSHLFQNISYNYYFDISHMIYLDVFYWHVPAAKLGNQWKNILLIFHPYLWVTIGVIFIINTTMWWFIEKENKNTKKFNWYIFYGLYSFLSGGIRLPKRTSVRILLIFWVLYSLLLSTIYQSQLLSILTTPMHEHQISTEIELAESSIEILVTIEGINHVIDSDLWYMLLIAKKCRIISIPEYILQRTNYKENTALPYSIIRTRYIFDPYYLYSDGTPKIYIFPKSSYSYIVNMYFRKGYPYFNKANDIILHLIQGGFVYKWIEESGKPIIKPSYKGPKKFTLYQLTGAFFLLITGMFISTVVFIIENGLKIIKDRQKLKEGL